MSVDDRLRSALRDQAETLSPEVERSLVEVRRRGRWARLRSAAFAPAVAAAAAAAVVGFVSWVGTSGTGEAPRPGEPVSPSVLSEPEAPSLRGRVVADVDQPRSMRGRWELQLNGNGTLDVTPPAGYPADVSGALFSSDRSTFRTTLFGRDLCRGQGTGIYEWRVDGDRVVFEVVSDPCGPRVRLVAQPDWTVSTGQGPQG